MQNSFLIPSSYSFHGCSKFLSNKFVDKYHYVTYLPTPMVCIYPGVSDEGHVVFHCDIAHCVDGVWNSPSVDHIPI